MRLLDRRTDFQEVLGVAPDGCKYIQNGVRYDPRGVALPGQGSSIPEPDLAPVDEPAVVPGKYPESELKEMHWQSLRKLMEANGLQWTNRQAAIEALKE